ncbi:collagen alpha-1(II) chain-like [Esox lucius]|uniref:collagen alpha-1(II) chain-like n=1 Tax=Esox lucius TaxID=8010 RepID=UPI001476E745|nr:collagen alpha-1(II) chain-like [Esox lucius]
MVGTGEAGEPGAPGPTGSSSATGRGGAEGSRPGGGAGVLGFRTAPAGWCHPPSQAQVAAAARGTEEGEAGERGQGVRQVRTSQSLSVRLSAAAGAGDEDEGESGVEDGGSACFGQVSRRLGRLLRRLPKSRSWTDGLRILRRTSSNGSLITSSSGTERRREKRLQLHLSPGV